MIIILRCFDACLLACTMLLILNSATDERVDGVVNTD